MYSTFSNKFVRIIWVVNNTPLLWLVAQQPILELNNSLIQSIYSNKVADCKMDILQQKKSYTSIGEIYFWTATIYKWLYLL